MLTTVNFYYHLKKKLFYNWISIDKTVFIQTFHHKQDVTLGLNSNLKIDLKSYPTSYGGIG